MFFWRTRAQRAAQKWLRYRYEPWVLYNYANAKAASAHWEGYLLRKNQWLAAMKEDHSYSEIFSSHGIEIDTIKVMLKACEEQYLLPAIVAVKLSDKTKLKEALVSWKTEDPSRFVTLMRSL